MINVTVQQNAVQKLSVSSERSATFQTMKRHNDGTQSNDMQLVVLRLHHRQCCQAPLAVLDALQLFFSGFVQCPMSALCPMNFAKLSPL